MLGDAVTLHFDEYDDTNIHPEDLQEWFRTGADYNAWQTPVLTRALEALTAGEPATSPVDGSEISAAPYIVFDAPLGRAHADSGRFIDLMVFIDAPLDVAMARRLIRDFKDGGVRVAEGLDGMVRECRGYLDGARPLYVKMKERHTPTCDLILDGCLSVDELAAAIVGKAREFNHEVREGHEGGSS
jgi:hypothetical protein